MSRNNNLLQKIGLDALKIRLEKNSLRISKKNNEGVIGAWIY